MPAEGRETFVRLQLIPKTITGTIDAAIGGTVTMPGGASVALPATGVVVAANNTAYTGTVNVAMHWLDPSATAITQATMPGDLRAIDSAGHLKALVTFGMLAVELTGSAGEVLQIAPGKKSGLHFPLPASISGTAPATIPLWYFDENNGLWKQDGNAVKNSSGYDGEVSHFTFWNCDISIDLVNFSLQVTDGALLPLANVEVSVSVADDAYNTRASYTNGNGEVNGMVPANSNLVIKIIPSCSDAITITTLQTVNNAIDLGTVNVNMQQAGATILGTVINCSGAPVVSGFAIIQDGNRYSSINVVNGVFNAAVAICPNSSVNVIVVDNETTSESEPRTVVLTTGSNDVGTLTACSSPAGEYINYVLDGVSKTLTLPQYLITAEYILSSNVLSISADDQINVVTGFKMNMDGPDIAGTHTLNDNNLVIDSNFTFTTPTTMTINQFGLVGEYIDGTYSGIIRAVSNNSTHTLSFTIHVKRDL